jgi:hypothetical protein
MTTVGDRLREHWDNIHDIVPDLQEDEVLRRIERISKMSVDFPDRRDWEQEKRRLEQEARRIGGQIRALDGLNDPSIRVIRDGLARVRDEAIAAASQPRPRSGGPRRHGDRFLRPFIAGVSARILHEARRPLTTGTSREGHWVDLSTILFEVAFDRTTSQGSMQRTCEELLPPDGTYEIGSEVWWTVLAIFKAGVRLKVGEEDSISIDDVWEGLRQRRDEIRAGRNRLPSE